VRACKFACVCVYMCVRVCGGGLSVWVCLSGSVCVNLSLCAREREGEAEKDGKSVYVLVCVFVCAYICVCFCVCVLFCVCVRVCVPKILEKGKTVLQQLLCGPDSGSFTSLTRLGFSDTHQHIVSHARLILILHTHQARHVPRCF